MIIFLITLSVAAIIGIIFLLALLRRISNKIQIVYPAEQGIKDINDYFDKMTVKTIPCHIICDNQFGAEADCVFYDFSQYEENQIVGMTVTHTETAENANLNEEMIQPFLLKNQKILLFKDGTYQWDYRKQN